MRKLIYVFPALAMSLFLTGCETDLVEPQITEAVSSSDAKKSDNYQAHLQPENEVSATPIISNATGQAIFKLSKDGTQLSYKLIVANMDNVLFGHLHLGAPGVNGLVVMDLVGAVSNPSGVIAEGVITSASLKGPLAGETLADLIAAIEAGLIYTNVHSPTYRGGEIRGQVK